MRAAAGRAGGARPFARRAPRFAGGAGVGDAASARERVAGVAAADGIGGGRTRGSDGLLRATARCAGCAWPRTRCTPRAAKTRRHEQCDLSG